MKISAKGCAMRVGMARDPKTDTGMVTVKWTDRLGDDVHREIIADLGQNGGDFGWPYCYADRIPDTRSTTPPPIAAKNVIPPKVQMQAQSPLGGVRRPGRAFPPEYRNNIFVAFHGSWNRSVPTGDKVVRVSSTTKGSRWAALRTSLPDGRTKKGAQMGVWRGLWPGRMARCM